MLFFDLRVPAVKRHLRQWLRSSIVLAMAAVFIFPQLLQLYALAAVSGECSMKCCNRKSGSCCRRAKAGAGAASAFRSLPPCAGKCGLLPAVLSKAGDCPRPAPVVSAAVAATTGDSPREIAPPSLPAVLGSQLFQRPPPSA